MCSCRGPVISLSAKQTAHIKHKIKHWLGKFTKLCPHFCIYLNVTLKIAPALQRATQGGRKAVGEATGSIASEELKQELTFGNML